MNNNENISISKLLAVLDIQDDESFIITDVELIDDKKYLHIQKKLEPVYCPRCGSRMHSKGFYTRKLNHPVLQDSTKFYMIVKQRKWHCDECNLYMNDSFPFLDRYAHSTTITPLLILNEFKHLDQSTAAIAERFNISDTLAHILFERYVDLPRLPLPEYMSIDEVYLNISNSQKYAFVIMDFSNGEIVDIVHNRWSSTLAPVLQEPQHILFWALCPFKRKRQPTIGWRNLFIHEFPKSSLHFQCAPLKAVQYLPEDMKTQVPSIYMHQAYDMEGFLFFLHYEENEQNLKVPSSIHHRLYAPAQERDGSTQAF